MNIPLHPLSSLQTIFHLRKQEFLKEISDSRCGAGNIQDEPELSVPGNYQNLKGSCMKECRNPFKELSKYQKHQLQWIKHRLH